MRWLLTVTVLFLIMTSARAADPAAKSLLESDPDGWTDLLAGGLAHWKRVVIPGDDKLSAKDPWSFDKSSKILKCDATPKIKEMLLFDKVVADGVFHVEFKFKKGDDEAEYNSGVYFRTAADGKPWFQSQVAHLKKPPFLGDVFYDDWTSGKPERVVMRGTANERAKPVGEWNTMEVSMKGKTIKVWVNGATTLTWDACPVDKGRVGLQAEFYEIEFRNLKLKVTH